MKCPRCQFENPEGMIFCGECGAKLEIICPECSFSNPLKFKFCGKCGYQLSPASEAPPKDLSFDEKLDKIQRYLPKGLTEKILAQRIKIEGERKQVTVMFCDMEGYTQLSRRLGPEEVYTIMDQIYEILIHKVHDYEGTVNEFTGDGIMALFGAPIALEDASQRAIRSAHAIHREMVRFSDRMKQEKENLLPLKMRIGIHTGPVVVGALGNDLRVEFKAVGDTVNLASRMEGLAEPGSTYVTEDTFRLTEGLFRFEALGEHSIKGRAGTVKAYRVISPSTQRTRFDVSAERGLTRFVGRERELELLMDGFQRSKTRKGQAFSIMSEAGVGKSRLLYEFRKAVANEDVIFMEGKCLSYSRGVAYHPVIDIVKSNFDVVEGDGDFEIREKLKRGLKILGADEYSTLPYLLELLSVKDSGVDPISLSPEARKDRIIEALNRIIIKASNVRPLIMAIEDLHWIDKSSEDALRDLLDCISGERVFLILTHRPEYIHTWGSKSYHSQVNLNRLSNREGLAMVTHLLGTEEIDKALEDLILEKTEGVPFFIEEFIKSLKDLKIIERKNNTYHLMKDIQEVSIPSTIQDVIMARVDMLTGGAKKIVQIGSVISREFSYELIQQVSDLSEKELLSNLAALKDSELVYERGIYPESIYIFRHALTREVLYDSILTKRKMSLHDEIGNAIERLYKDNIDENYELLAEHYTAAGNYEKAAEYCRLASKKAEKTASLNDAIIYTKKRVRSLESLIRTDDVIKNTIDARTALGLYTLQIGYLEEAKEAITPIIDLAVKHGMKRRLSQIYIIIGTCNYMVEEDFAEAFKHLEKGLKLSEEINDIISSVLANYYLGIALTFNCEFEKAFHYIDRARKINEVVNNLWGMSVMKSHLSFPYIFQGQINFGYQNSKEALQIAEESGDIYSKAMAYTIHGFSCYYMGLFADAIKNLTAGADFGERINYFAWNSVSQFYLGESFFEIGEYQKARAYYEKAIWFLEYNIWFPSFMNLHKVALARASLRETEKFIDLESLYDLVSGNRLKVWDGLIRKYLGETLINIGDQRIPEAEALINKAIDSDKRNGLMWHLGKDYAFYSELLKRRGDFSMAKENLGNAIKIFKECGADAWVGKYEKKLLEFS
jgi:class 3 adenylate cyclase/tetratricopeptide (TPR) repeat protein